METRDAGVDWCAVGDLLAAGHVQPPHVRCLAPYFLSEAEAKRFIAQSRWRHYVYGLCGPAGDVFYIGKGRDSRMFCHRQDAECGVPGDKAETLRRLGDDIRYTIFAFFDTEGCALLLEGAMIDANWPYLLNRRRETLLGAAAGVARREIHAAATDHERVGRELAELSASHFRRGHLLRAIAAKTNSENMLANAEAVFR